MTVRQIKQYYRYGNLRKCTQEKQGLITTLGNLIDLDFYFHFGLVTSGKSDMEIDRLLRERETAMYSEKMNQRPTIGRIWEVI